jgi:large subunit ribosomal protein L10
MKKISLIFKETAEKVMRDNLKSANAFFILTYSNLSSPDLTSLRQSLRDSHASFFVVKNSVARRALKSAGLESMVKFIEGPCGLVTVLEEPASVSKVLYNFHKEHEGLKLEGGFLGDRLLDKKDIEALAKLPSREALRHQAVGILYSLLSGLVYTLKGNLNKLVYCLEDLKNKKTTN